MGVMRGISMEHFCPSHESASKRSPDSIQHNDYIVILRARKAFISPLL